jgi:hypothetical protein
MIGRGDVLLFEWAPQSEARSLIDHFFERGRPFILIIGL